MTVELPSALKGKFAGDTAWNFLAFGVMAAVGVIINFFIAGYLGARALGIFNQGYAVFVVGGQLAAFGIQDSVQKHIAEHYPDHPDKARAAAAGAIVAVAITALPLAAILGLSHAAIGRVVDSADVGRTIAIVAPGVALFALNKVLMGGLNGRREMRLFAFGQAFRGCAILVSCLAFGLFGAEPYWLAGAFTVAEAALLPFLLVMDRGAAGGSLRDIRDWTVRHLLFGLRAMPNGFLAESYIRVDVLMLALFVGDADIGIYSFAAMFIEGLFQIPVVVRTVANPILVKFLVSTDMLALVTFARKIAAISLVLTAAIAIVVWFVFPYLAPFFKDGLVSKAEPVLHILVFGIVAYAPLIPLDQSLLLAGLPGRQSILMAANLAGNVGLNLVLIPRFGVSGAAIATAISFTLSGLTLSLAARQWLGLRRGFLMH